MKHHEGPHKYYRSEHRHSKTPIYRCGLPGCTHFVYEALIINLNSICWRCEEVFTILKKTLRNKKFHCEGCTRGRDKSQTENIVDKLLGDGI